MVKVYSTPTCPWCNRVKEYLREKNVDLLITMCPDQ